MSQEKTQKIAKAKSVSCYNINNNFLGIKDRIYSPLSLWGEIKKQPLIDIHDQVVSGFDFFSSRGTNDELKGKSFQGGAPGA